MGFLAYNPIITLLKAVTNTVAVTTAGNGIPAALRIPGLTTTMYADARKVVIPATISLDLFILAKYLVANELFGIPGGLAATEVFAEPFQVGIIVNRHGFEINRASDRHWGKQ